MLAVRRTRQESTLLCVTHEPEAAMSFDRVLIMERGRIVEDGTPSELAAAAEGKFSAMLTAARQRTLEGDEAHHWRFCTLEDGALG